MIGATSVLRKPLCHAGFGAATRESWRDSLVWFSVESNLAPRINLARIRLSAGAASPGLSVDDQGSVALGYEDGGSATVFTGAVAAIESCIDGGRLIALCDGSAALAGIFLSQSYEMQKGGDIVRDLAQRSSVRTGAIHDGVDLPFFAMDASCDAYTVIARLAADSRFRAGVNPEGELDFGPWPSGRSVCSFTRGEDILYCDVTRRRVLPGRTVVTGEGASGSQGQDAWPWLLGDSSSMAVAAGASGESRVLARGELRSNRAVSDAAAAIDSAGAARRAGGRLVVPGTPELTAGDLFEITDDADLAGPWHALSVRHTYSKSGGFTTRVRFCSSGGTGGGGRP